MYVLDVNEVYGCARPNEYNCFFLKKKKKKTCIKIIYTRNK